MVVLGPRLLAVLAERHGSREMRRRTPPPLSVEMIARLLTEAAQGRVVAVPAMGEAEASVHPLGHDLRIVHRAGPGRSVCQCCRNGAWQDLQDVAVEAWPEGGFALDASALRRAAGPLDPELELAQLGGPGPGPP